MQRHGIALLIPLAACGATSAGSTVEPDALHCSVTFEKYAIISKLNGDERMSKGLLARQSWYVEQVSMLPPAERSHERIDKLAKEADAMGENDLGVLKACMERQDNDPAYKVWLQQ